MADAPVPVPTEPAPTPAPGNLFASYQPEGAMGGLFAPAYIRGFAPSEQAVANWQAQHRAVTSDLVDQLRMPDLYGSNPPSGRTLADGVYSSGVPSVQNYAHDPRGAIDVNALRAASMGTPYDLQGRRDAIAARLAQNAALQGMPAPTPPPAIAEDKFKGRDPLQEQIDDIYKRLNATSTTY